MKVEIGRKNKAVVRIDKEDFYRLKSEGWTFSLTEHGYVFCNKYIGKINGKYKYERKYLHALIMKTPRCMFTDHINGDRLDNRKKNLRICTPYESSLNTSSRKNKTSKYKGVHKHSVNNSWSAQISVNGKTIHVGSFNNEKDAAIAYNDAAKKYHRSYAKINFIN